MASLKIFALGGLDKKSNDLTRQPDKATDVLNMEYNTQSTLKKRNGYASVSNIVCDDMIYYSSKDEKLFFTANSADVYIKSALSNKTLAMPFNIGNTVSVSSCENTTNMYFVNGDYSLPVMKYDGSNIYRAGLPTPRITNDNPPTLTGAGAGRTRIFYSFKDINGLTIFSPYYDFNTLIGGGDTLTVNTLKTDLTCQQNGFLNRYCWMNNTISFFIDPTVSSTAFPLSSLDRTRLMPVKRSNYIAGDLFLFDSEIPFVQIGNDTLGQYPASKSFLNLEIESVGTYSASVTGTRTSGSSTVTGVSVGDIAKLAPDMFISGAGIPANATITTIGINSFTMSANATANSSLPIAVTHDYIIFKQINTFDYSVNLGSLTNLATLWVTNTGKTEWALDCRTRLHVYSDSASTGVFIELYNFIMDGSSITNAIVPTSAFNFNSKILTNYQSYFEDIYDSASSKIMPPYCKYIASYGEQIVYANIESYIGFNNRKIPYNNNDLIIYSDVLQGDCCENTSEFNRQKIGETNDGEITGASRCNDSMVIFKTSGVFSIDGALMQGQYTLRKINTNNAGCTSHKSIVATDEGLFYQAHNGIYFTNGINAKRVSFELDYFFESGSYSDVRAARLKKKQKTIFYIPSKSKAVIIDYYYNQVYLWNGFTPSKGIIEDASGDVFFSNGLTLYKFNDSYSDNGNPINAIYSTTWHHVGEPSLRKKFLQLRIFALTIDPFNLDIKTQVDWSDPDNTYAAPTIKSSVTKTFSATDQTIQYVLNMLTTRSLRIIFSNSVNNQNMVLTGYELTYEPYNVRDKD